MDDFFILFFKKGENGSVIIEIFGFFYSSSAFVILSWSRADKATC